MKKNPLGIRKPELSLDTLKTCLKDSLKNPYIGVTQGGSSRKDRGAKPAATVAQVSNRKEP